MLLVATLMIVPGAIANQHGLDLLMWSLGGVSFSLSLVSRTRFGSWSAVGFVYAYAALAFFVTFAIDSPSTDLMTTIFAWHLLALVLAQIFLRFRGLLWVFGLSIAGILLLPLFHPTVGMIGVMGAFGLVLTVGSLLLVFQRHRDGLERDHLGELRAAKREVDSVNTELVEEVEVRQAAQTAAEAANRAKSAFLANMSHEFRTPLNAIIGYTELVVEELEATQGAAASEYTGDLKSVLAASEHLLRLISDILDLSKVEAGKMPLVPEKLDLKDILAYTHSVVGSLALRGGNRFISSADNH